MGAPGEKRTCDVDLLVLALTWRFSRRGVHLESARLLTEVLGGRTLAERHQRLHDMARSRALSPDQVSQVAATPVGFRTIVREAATNVPGRDPEFAVFVWTVRSGIAHTQTWASIAASDRTFIGQTSPTVWRVKLTPTDRYLLAAAQVPAVMIHEGWKHSDRAVAFHRHSSLWVTSDRLR
jgi:hypothetical protein